MVLTNGTSCPDTMNAPKAKRWQPSLFCLLLVFISFHLHGISRVSIGGFNTTAWDWAIGLVALYWLFYMSLGVLRFSQRLKYFIILMGVFQIWMVVSAFASPEPTRALTMLVLQLRNFILVVVVTTLYDFKIELQRLNQMLFVFGAVVATVSVVLYVPAMSSYGEIVALRQLWKPGIVYVLDQGGVIRLIGFALDPNFFSLWMSLSLTTGLTLKPSRWRTIGMVLIVLSLALALSRGFVAAVVASLVILSVGGILKSTVRRSLRSYLRPLRAGLPWLIALVGGLIVTGGVFWQQVMTRVQLAAATPRFAMWASLFGTEFNPFVGLGLRGAEEALAGKYSHNTYLDVLFETGLVGMIIWIVMISYVTWLGFKQMAGLAFLPWIHTWLITLGMFASLSLTYNPFPWLLAAVIIGSGNREETVKGIPSAAS